MEKAILFIPANGKTQALPKCPTHAEMQAFVGGELEHVRILDRIEPLSNGEKFIYSSMYVDENGRLDENRPINKTATDLYRRNAREQIKRGTPEETFGPIEKMVIVGDVVYFEGYTVEEAEEAFLKAQGIKMSAKQIYKYEIAPANKGTTIMLKAGAIVRHFAWQNGVPHIWVEHNMDEKAEQPRTFAIFGTGHEIPLSAAYIGTISEGVFVWHLYQVFE